jgi:hypothetical protein
MLRALGSVPSTLKKKKKEIRAEVLHVRDPGFVPQCRFFVFYFVLFFLISPRYECHKDRATILDILV